MTIDKEWRELHRTRFPTLPLDCGNAVDPGIIYSEDLRDWSDKATTPDQARMERYIDRFDLREKRILHVGIGDSGLARRFHRRVGEIVGTTIDEPERKVAQSLGIPHYKFVVQNKYSGCDDEITGKFDFILDNNPTSPCCCVRHLAVLFDLYDKKLAGDGQIVTDRQGLEWVPEDSNPRWSFSFEDLEAVAAVAGFSAFRVNRNVFVLARSAPQAPRIASLARHWGRTARALPGRAVRHGPRMISSTARKLVKSVLLAVAPWALPKRFRTGTSADRRA